MTETLPTPPSWVADHECGDQCCTVTMQVMRPINASTESPVLQLWLDNWHKTLRLYYELSEESAVGYGPVYTCLSITGEQKQYTIEIRDCEKILGGSELLFSLLLDKVDGHECMMLLASTGEVRFFGEAD